VSIQAVLLPVFVQVALTSFLMFWMARTRFGALRSGQVKVRDIALGQRAWPERPTQIANAFHNQFETPVLFYVLVVLALITHKADWLFLAMAWIFVACRIAHALIHTTSNDIRLRFFAFVIGAFVLTLMWIIFAVRILASA
jgi:hypothetical protein